jgi:TM2 domain-containing membrane protein YozV
MKDKNIAGILALFLGWAGVHRFYLGQNILGIIYLMFFWFPLIWVIALVDGISLLTMDQQVFDTKYNKRFERYFRNLDTDFNRDQRSEPDFRRRQPFSEPPVAMKNPVAVKKNLFKQTGLEKFKDYDYLGAVEDFKKSLELEPKDIATHFNLACAYSLLEESKKAFHHLDKAVEFGFKDFQKIKQHHALAYIRVLPEFDDFVENNYRLRKGTVKEEDLLSTEPNLLDQIKKLGELREKGLLSEKEFDEQKRKLLG